MSASVRWARPVVACVVGLAALQLALPTGMSRTPTSRAAAMQPTPAPIVVAGRMALARPADPCQHDAIVRECFTDEVRRIRSDTDLSAFIGYDVRIQGVEAACEGGGTYTQVSSISVLPGGCGPTPTPPPTPTPQPATNLALRAPLVVRDQADGYPSRNVNDGDPSSAWRSDLDVTWIYLDLGHGVDTSRTFNQIVLHWGGAHAQQYAMYVWEQDGWNGIYQTFGDSDGGEDIVGLPRIYGRYVLLYLIRSSAGRGYELREWEIYGRDTVNQALGGAAEVSSAEAGYPGHLANDGDRATFWRSRDRAADANPWIRVWLPGIYLAEIRLYWGEAAFPRLFTVVIYDGDSMRQSTWYPKGTDNRIAPPAPIRADAVLVYSRESSTSGAVALAEIELYELGMIGSAAAAERASWRYTGASPRRRTLALPLDMAPSAAETSLATHAWSAGAPVPAAAVPASPASGRAVRIEPGEAAAQAARRVPAESNGGADVVPAPSDAPDPRRS